MTGLLPLPERDYDASIVRSVHSTHQALVRFDGNAYSVPIIYAYKTLLLRANDESVRIISESKEIACHARSYDRGAFIEDPKHFEGLLAMKKKALTNRIYKSFLDLGPAAGDYLEGLVASHVHIGRHLTQIMELVAAYGKEEVLAAMSHALKFNAFGSAYVQNILLQKRTAQGFKEILPIHIPQQPAWNEIVTEEPDLSVYDKLTEDSGEKTDGH